MKKHSGPRRRAVLPRRHCGGAAPRPCSCQHEGAGLGQSVLGGGPGRRQGEGEGARRRPRRARAAARKATCSRRSTRSRTSSPRRSTRWRSRRPTRTRSRRSSTRPRQQGVGVVFVDTKGINDGVTFIGTNNEVGAALAADFICKNIAEGQRGGDPSGHHHPVDRPGARRRLQEGPDRLRPQRRRRAAGRLGYRQGPVGDGEHPHRQSQPQGGLRLQRQHGARRGPGAQVGQHARQGDGGRLRRQPQRRRVASSPAR